MLQNQSFGFFSPSASLTHLSWVLPVGISFYTFQTISYTIDVYRGTIKAERDPITFLTYVAFFPQLLAGPIERAKTLMPQFHRAHRFELDAMKKAFLRILWGAFKKSRNRRSVGYIRQSGLCLPRRFNDINHRNGDCFLRFSALL